jgi:hypothetical protein
MAGTKNHPFFEVEHLPHTHLELADLELHVEAQVPKALEDIGRIHF